MWTKVANVSELQEGCGKVVIANGKELALFNAGGTFYALDNTCPHRGGPLGEGSLDGSEVTCPWHAWGFDVKTGACQTVTDIKQPTFPVKVEDEDVLVQI